MRRIKEGFIKIACTWSKTCGTTIETYNPNNNNIKLASASAFGDVKTFPEKYASCLEQYITAIEKDKFERNRFERIGDYDPEFHYYRVISVHGNIPNDNGDMFLWGSIDNPEEPELLRFEDSLAKYVYQTFVGRGNFKNHKNNDVSLAVGINLDVVANHKGKFIENLLAVDAKKDPELVRSIDKGYTTDVSMGAKVARSICSACGHVAYNEDQYCNCIKNFKGQRIYINGSMQDVYEDNRGVNFIELSWVTVGADKDAKLLEKIAKHFSEDAIEATATLISLYGEEKTKKILLQIKNN
ncbi:MAG: hypothetical protein ACFFG0_05245 [Candidatus Thorarchaeota archaeon]